MELATKLLVLFLSALVVGQEPIRVDVSLVTVGVQVRDSRGREVPRLTAESFALFEDGVQQDIAFFSSDPQPVALGILLDSSSSMSQQQKIDRARDAARALVRGLQEGSEFAYVDFDDQVRVATGFTGDRQYVESMIDGAGADGGTSLYDAIAAGLRLTGQVGLARQAMVIVSDGADQHSRRTLAEIIDIVRQSEMQIYTIGYFTREEEGLFRNSGSKISLINGDEVDNPRIALEKIAEESGAESFFPRSDEELARAVSEIRDDLKTQYTISFYPDRPDRNDYRRLRVTVRGSRYRVRARPGYGTREVASEAPLPDTSLSFEGNVQAVIRADGLKSTELTRWPLMRRPSDNHKIEVVCAGSDCEFHEGDALLGRLAGIDSSEGRIGFLLAERGRAVFTNLSIEEIR